MAKRARRAHDDCSEGDASAVKRARSRQRAKTPESTVGDRGHAAASHVVADPRPLRTALLEWYAGVHESRGMPWRKPYDPTLGPAERAQRAYEVWISEIMLQQTQVATVIPYYNRWMARFPTIDDLAASDIDTVNALWKGLGYYSRAARLLQGARKAVEELGGRLPDNAGDLEARMPGIGRYSAGAICSIAYNQCVPVLDGNVHRLLSRLLALYAPPKAKQTLDILWAAAAALVEDSARPGDVNQALIELGSTVCKVHDPQCGSCPLRAWCGASRGEKAAEEPPRPPRAAAGEAPLPDVEDLCTVCAPLPAARPPTVFPMKAARKKPREELDVVHVVEWRHADERWFLLVRRPDGGLLAGLHEFPTDPAVAPAALAAPALRAAPHRLLARMLAHPPPPPHTPAGGGAGLRIAAITPAGDVVHVFSHIRKTYRVQWVLLAGGGPGVPALAAAAAPGARWTRLADVADANVGTGVLKVWRQACALWADDAA